MGVKIIPPKTKMVFPRIPSYWVKEHPILFTHLLLGRSSLALLLGPKKASAFCIENGPERGGRTFALKGLLYKPLLKKGISF